MGKFTQFLTEDKNSIDPTFKHADALKKAREHKTLLAKHRADFSHHLLSDIEKKTGGHVHNQQGKVMHHKDVGYSDKDKARKKELETHLHNYHNKHMAGHKDEKVTYKDRHPSDKPFNDRLNASLAGKPSHNSPDGADHANIHADKIRRKLESLHRKHTKGLNNG